MVAPADSELATQVYKADVPATAHSQPTFFKLSKGN